jgi:hypothetical protein
MCIDGLWPALWQQPSLPACGTLAHIFIKRKCANHIGHPPDERRLSDSARRL